MTQNSPSLERTFNLLSLTDHTKYITEDWNQDINSTSEVTAIKSTHKHHPPPHLKTNPPKSLKNAKNTKSPHPQKQKKDHTKNLDKNSPLPSEIKFCIWHHRIVSMVIHTKLVAASSWATFVLKLFKTQSQFVCTASWNVLFPW